MRRRSISRIGFFTLFLCAGTAGLGIAQVASGSRDGKTPDVFANLKFRNMGPAIAGGRVTATVGIPGIRTFTTSAAPAPACSSRKTAG